MAKISKFFCKNFKIENIDEKYTIVSTNDDGVEEYLTFDEVIEDVINHTTTGVYSIELKDFLNRQPPKRKPIYKYKCPNCGKEVKSDIEDLHAQCKDCEVDYILKEGK